MAVKNFLKKAAPWLLFFLCIFFMGRASVSLGYLPAGAIHGENAGIIFLEHSNFSGDYLFGPAAFHPEEVGSLKVSSSPRATSPRVSGKVTAGWYGSEHQNKLMASGQRFNMHKNTLAHRILPLGTKVRLVNPHNGKSAEGVVSDRGPYVKGRDVDVSYSMAKQLGIIKKGVMKLNLERI